MGGWSTVPNFSLQGRDEENTTEDSMKEWNKSNILAQVLCQNKGKGNITYKQGAGEEQRLRIIIESMGSQSYQFKPQSYQCWLDIQLNFVELKQTNKQTCNYKTVS